MTPSTKKNLIPAQLAFHKLGVSREKGMRMLLTREIEGEMIGTRWYVNSESLERRIAEDGND